MRNPWRCSFDKENPAYFFCGDVGQGVREKFISLSVYLTFALFRMLKKLIWLCEVAIMVGEDGKALVWTSLMMLKFPITSILFWNTIDLNRDLLLQSPVVIATEVSFRWTRSSIYSRLDVDISGLHLGSEETCLEDHYVFADLYNKVFSSIENPPGRYEFLTTLITHY